MQGFMIDAKVSVNGSP
ncbi:Protein of unknown function [Bacillus mycoides]|nr:Protein of unknown function [Bacillus mycoides]